MKWIDVKERLPKIDDRYLVFMSGAVSIAHYDHTKENPFLTGGGSIKATHWAVIPQGPVLDAVLNKKIDVTPTAWDQKWNDESSPLKRTIHFNYKV